MPTYNQLKEHDRVMSELGLDYHGNKKPMNNANPQDAVNQYAYVDYSQIEDDEFEEEQDLTPDYYTCMCCGNVQQSSMDCNKCAGPVSESWY